MDHREGFEKTDEGCQIRLGGGKHLAVQAFRHGFHFQIRGKVKSEKDKSRGLLFEWDQLEDVMEMMRMSYGVFVESVVFGHGCRVSCRFRPSPGHHDDMFWFLCRRPIHVEFLGEDLYLDRETYVVGELESFLHEAMVSTVMES